MKAKLGKHPKGDSPRRVSIEVDNFDTWSMEHTVALLVLPMLIQLKNTMHGVPGSFVNDEVEDYYAQKVFDFMQEDKDEVFVQGVKRWNDTLDKMIWSFQQLALDDDYDSKYHHGKMKTDWVPSEHKILNPVTGKMERTFEMIDLNPHEHWSDYVGHEMHNARIQEGLELFGKHLRDLWD